eukprot:403332590
MLTWRVQLTELDDNVFNRILENIYYPNNYQEAKSKLFQKSYEITQIRTEDKFYKYEDTFISTGFKDITFGVGLYYFPIVIILYMTMTHYKNKLEMDDKRQKLLEQVKQKQQIKQEISKDLLN